ncbi:putative serine/threonine-protein kinase pats1 [Mytilus galloprovincialis]|uniref:putative serine/threonine-protein kinase pats1 n=1 Tax=Mytilus galloprovincialis TaxID=29158 RepID=UPI003F7C6BB4
MQNSETQKRYFVKIMIVGKESVGKTCLLRNLLKEDIKDVSSTDGIHIVIHRSKINIENGKWIIEKDRPKDTQDSIKLHILNNSTQLIMPSGLMSDLFTATSISKSPSNNYARCGLWDFAGQKEFYCTNQAFLTSSAIYLVVADMKTNFVTEQQQQDTTEVAISSLSDLQEEDYVGFWFDSIHCYRTVDRRTDEESMDPPVIVVLTGKDRIGKNELQDRQTYLNDQFSQLHGEQEKYQHYRHKYFISNTKDPDKIFEKIRTKISEIAKKMPLWGKSVPLKWILLEHLINLNRDCGKHFVSFKDMIKMAKHPEIEILDKGEVSTFLHFQHEVGNIIFFKDIPDLIILEPQWLANAFRCLVSDRFNIDDVHDVSPKDKRQISADWTLLHNKGKISDLLINTLFKLKGGDYFLTQKKHLLEVMKKFDILMQIEGETAYIMPSMFPPSSISTVCMKIGIVNANCQRTSWFCMKFKFLPPSFFNHLLVWLMKTYRPTRVTSEFALYRGLCVFDLESSQCDKLLMTMSIDTIALQIVSFSKQTLDLLEVCSGIRKDMRRKIVNLKKRYGIELSYEQMFKCSDCTCHTDAFSLKQLKEHTKNYCSHHQKAHESATICFPWAVESTESPIEKGMKEKHSQILQACSEHMVENLYNVDMICEYLEIDDILTEEIRDKIKHKNGRQKRTKELLFFLPSRGEKAYERFIEALKITENTNVAHYLEQQVGSTG